MKMSSHKCILITLLVLLTVSGFAQHNISLLDSTRADTPNEKRFFSPLLSAAQYGDGPLVLPYLRNSPIGSAYVFGSPLQDIFAIGDTRSSDLYLLKWLRNTEEGVPVFDTPIEIKSFFTPNGTVFQTHDGVIHGLWLKRDSIIHTLFDKSTFSFIIKDQIKLPNLPRLANSVAAYPNEDGSVDLVLEVRGFSTPSKNRQTNASSNDWRPYDAAGISTSSFSYTYLYSLHFPTLLGGEPQKIQQATKTNKEVLSGMTNFTPVNLGSGHTHDLIVGAKLGIFPYYQRDDVNGIKFSAHRYMVGEDGNVLHHPSISPSVCTYQEYKTGITNIIAGGEGAIYFYRFTGKFNSQGDPIFKQPVPILQQDAYLYAGTLPVPSSVDWDGDGALDLMVGNSEGFVLFFKNIGDNVNPKFLPGTRVLAGGREIQVQGGYSGSIQGTGESRWGYLSPTVIDWTGNGLPDIVMGDITGNYTVYINRGTKTKPLLDAAKSLYCEGLELHGMWRSRAAVGMFGKRMGLAIVDGDDQFHMYWKMDDYNVEDGGKLLLDDGSTILTSAEPAGGTGRCKLDFFDYDGDGKLDLIIGNGRRSAIPNMGTGYPLPVLGNVTLGTPLFMKNISTNDTPVFSHPSPFHLDGVGLLQPGGSHESGAIGTSLGGGNQRNLIVGNEVGRLYLLQGTALRLMNLDEAKQYHNQPNPLRTSKPIEEKPKPTDRVKDIPTEVNVPYGIHERQVLDFYKANSNKPTPLVIFMHGGGWVTGDKKNVPELSGFLEAGISVVSINYRYTWQAQLAGVEPPIKWPLEDAARALQFVRSKAKDWNIDKVRIGATGSSAGAFSSLYLTLHDDMAYPKSSDPIARESTRFFTAAVKFPQTSLDPKQLIEWTPNSTYGGHAFGLTDPNDTKKRDAFFAEFLKNRETLLPWIKMYSPYELVSADDPNIYMIYTFPPAIGQPQKDPTHTPNYGVKLQEHCVEFGVNCELVYPGALNVTHTSMEDYLIEKLTSTLVNTPQLKHDEENKSQNPKNKKSKS